MIYIYISPLYPKFQNIPKWYLPVQLDCPNPIPWCCRDTGHRVAPCHCLHRGRWSLDARWNQRLFIWGGYQVSIEVSDSEGWTLPDLKKNNYLHRVWIGVSPGWEQENMQIITYPTEVDVSWGLKTWLKPTKFCKIAHLIEALMDVHGFPNICGFMFDDSRNLRGLDGLTNNH